ncbi:hypothetical protein Q8A73_002941 [Channa argus]|nr:hypothetical protein Q8A73_002941 [Channa argus]
MRTSQPSGRSLQHRETTQRSSPTPTIFMRTSLRSIAAAQTEDTWQQEDFRAPPRAPLENPPRKVRELFEMMQRRKVDILCVQDTRWKGSKARSLGAGFKLFHHGSDRKRNGVGVILKEEFVLEVKRVSDRLMMFNVVSGYGPQVGCELEEKEKFWSELDEVMQSFPRVTLTCSSDANPAANYTWYKKNQTVVNKKNENQPLNQEPQLVFASIQSSYSGQYYCEAENKLGRSRSEDVSLNVKWKSLTITNIISLTLVVLIPLLVMSLWMRKKKTQNFKSELNESVEMIESVSQHDYQIISAATSITAAQRDDTEQHKDLV